MQCKSKELSRAATVTPWKALADGNPTGRGSHTRHLAHLLANLRGELLMHKASYRHWPHGEHEAKCKSALA